jgi:hypothetical protein
MTAGGDFCKRGLQETIKGADGLARAPSMFKLMPIVRATGADQVGAERVSASRSN